MTATCSNICDRYRVPSPSKSPKHGTGIARCNTCDIWLDITNNIGGIYRDMGDRRRCVCCGSPISVTPRHGRKDVPRH